MTDTRLADLGRARHQLDRFGDALDYATRDIACDGDTIGDPDPALTEPLDLLARALGELYDHLDELADLLANDTE